MINGKLKIRENNPFSLSCRGSVTIKDSIITTIWYTGITRKDGSDRWMNWFENKSTGDEVTQEELDKLLEWNGKRNVVSKFTEKP